MKAISKIVSGFSQEDIAEIQHNEGWTGDVNGDEICLTQDDFEINAKDIPGWVVASEGKLTVALDVTVTERLKAEGIARELINKVQNLRKDNRLEVTDKIVLNISSTSIIESAINTHKEYISNEVLASEINFVKHEETIQSVDIENSNDTRVSLIKK